MQSGVVSRQELAQEYQRRPGVENQTPSQRNANQYSIPQASLNLGNRVPSHLQKRAYAEKLYQAEGSYAADPESMDAVKKHQKY